jgi:hypothetical protein
VTRGNQENMQMYKLRFIAAVLALTLAGAASAQGLPNYYPKGGFQRTGVLDAVQPEAQRIVIGDLGYLYSSNLVVHSPRSYSVPLSRLKPGTRVAFKTLENRGRVITEIWLLPDNYDDGSRRR